MAKLRILYKGRISAQQKGQAYYINTDSYIRHSLVMSEIGQVIEKTKTNTKHAHIFNIYISSYTNTYICSYVGLINQPHWDGLMINVSTCHAVRRGFAPWLGHSKDHHKNCTTLLPAWHTDVNVRVGVWQCNLTV